MAHISLEELAKKLIDAEREVEVGARYFHYKDQTKEYIVKSLAILEASEEVAVVYEAQYSDRVSFVRPLRDFCSMVYVDDKQTSRFTKI